MQNTLRILLIGCFVAQLSLVCNGQTGTTVAQAPPSISSAASPLVEAKAPKRLPVPEIAKPDLPVPAKWQWRKELTREYPTRELLASIEQSLMPVESPSKPAVIVFPIVDENNAIRSDGGVLSLMAAYLLNPISDISAHTTPTEFMEILRDANCW